MPSGEVMPALLQEILLMPAFWYAVAILGSVLLIAAAIAAVAVLVVVTFLICQIARAIGPEVKSLLNERRQRRLSQLNPAGGNQSEPYPTAVHPETAPPRF